ncbi:MAG: M6 family metalloprotease domain-containing protein [candidate division Zixibacteria bacterium]|nr:M6 family metalloprotease domain-containing protein [candidate division Zixibacteria bacterium]
MGETIIHRNKRTGAVGVLAYRRDIFGWLICTLVFLMIWCAAASAMPPHPETYTTLKAGGQTMPYYLQHRPEFLQNQRNVQTSSLTARSTAYGGEFHALAILIEFSDQANSVSASEFDDLLFVNQQGSLRHYYREVSYDNFDVVSVNLPSSLGWITAPQTYEYYCNANNGTGAYPHNSQKLCEDVVAAIDPMVDFSQYDNDNDGFVDAVILVHTGPGAEFTMSNDDIWSHMWATASPVVVDGVRVWKYSIQPEYWMSPGDITLGVFCHEFGHILGLPDLYDTDRPSDAYGIGNWSIMSYGSWLGAGNMGGSPAHFDAWCRIQLGFVTPTVVSDSTSSASLSAIETTPQVYRLWYEDDGGPEYFLIENRQKTGYDSYLAGSGLLIWHIDETQSDNDDEWYPDHTTSGNLLVALEQADGLFELEQKQSVGNSGDPFPGSTNADMFSPATTPNTNSYTGDNTGLAITNISSSAAVMTMDFQVSFSTGEEEEEEEEEEPTDMLPVGIHLGQNYPNPFNPQTSIDFFLPSTATATIVVHDLLGRAVKTLIDEPCPAGTLTVTWDGTDDDGNRMASGVYFYRLQTERELRIKKMILVK